MQLNMESRRLEKVGGLIRGEDYMTALRLREQASIGSLLQTINSDRKFFKNINFI